MNQPILSIIVPVYNVQDYLDTCIESLISQTYERIEIILVDDGSTDDSGRICDDYALKDKRIVVIHKQNGGPSEARNAGIEIANGAYLGFVDPDDWISTKMYEVLFYHIEDSGADIAMCERVVVYSDKTYNYGYTDAVSVLDRDAALDILYADVKYASYVWNKLYRKRLFENIRFPIGKLYEDVYIMHELFGLSNQVVCIDSGLYYYRQRENSIVNSKDLDNWKEYMEALVSRRNSIYSVGREELIFRNILDAAETIKSIMDECPKDDKSKALMKNIHHIILKEMNLWYGIKLNLRAILIVFHFPLYCILVKRERR